METSKTTEYLDGFQGLSAGSPLILKFVPTAEGYYNFENNKYIYSYTDHLGNIRLSYSKSLNGSAEVLEENNYYPFGLKREGYNVLAGNPAYSYGYNGKELQKETGWGDYGARMYMADIGRWVVIDPLAEQMRRYSPYNYAFNNPVSYTDPDGRKPMIYNADGVMRWEFDPLITINGTAWFEGPALSYGGFGGSSFLSQGFTGGGGDGSGAMGGEPDNNPKPSAWQSVKNFFKSLVGGGKKSSGRLEVGPAERIADYDADGVRLFGLITGANYNPMEKYRANRDNPFYNEGESSLDRSFRLMNSSHIEIMQDFGGGGYNMFGGYGGGTRAANAVQRVATASEVAAEAEVNGFRSLNSGINPDIVAGYLEEMSAGTFNRPVGVAGFRWRGRLYFNDGNHRMNAAIQYKIQTGSYKYMDMLMDNAKFDNANPVKYGKVYRFPVKPTK